MMKRTNLPKQKTLIWTVALTCLLMGLLLLTPAPVTHADLGTEVIFIGAEGAGTYSTAWGDWDNDGDLDLAVGNAGLNQVYENDEGMWKLDPANGFGWESTGDEKDTRCVTWGDWDGDGDLDLAIGNYGQVNQIYQNRGGNLSLAWESTGDVKNTTSIAWGDWDGDNDLDLAVGNSDQVNQVYENDIGTLQLDPGTGFGWESLDEMRTQSVAWGDWDNDGNLDLAVGNDQVNQVYENDGGELVLAWTSTNSYPTYSVAWGDWDGDGDLDLAIGNGSWGGTPNEVYENVGGWLNRAWLSSEEADEDKDTQSVAWGDWDGDGDLDLAVGNEARFYMGEYYDGENQVYENNEGTLTLDPAAGLGWESPDEDSLTYSVSWGDWDNDGDLDLVVGNSEANYMYENDMGGRLEQDSNFGWQSIGDRKWTTSIAWGDWDGDGDLDLAIGNDQDDNVNQVYENDGETLVLDPANGFGWESPDEMYTQSVAWGDWDGDGDLDLAVGNGEVNQVYENDGGTLVLDPVNSFGWESPDEMSTRSVAWGDWDGDGDLDLAVGNYDQVNQVYENDGGTLVLDSANGFGWESPDEMSTQSVAWGDWDGDGDLDLAVGNHSEVNQVYENNGGTLVLDYANGFGWKSPDEMNTQSVAWGDWDGDGDLDLAVGNRFEINQVYENDSRTLQLDLENDLGWTFMGNVKGTLDMAWGDWDGDGDLDLVVGNGADVDEPEVEQVYENDGEVLILGYGFGWVSPRGHNTESVAWGDWDGDGDLDLATGNWIYGSINRVYENMQRGSDRLVNNPPRIVVYRPDGNDDANFFSSPQILSSTIVPITYTLFDPEGVPVNVIIPEFSSNGGGQWFPATIATETITSNLSAGHYMRHAGAKAKLPLALVDGGTVSTTLSISSAYKITDLDLWLNITHTQNVDLEAVLISPGGITATLFRSGSLTGSHLIGTVFDDEAAALITESTSPYTRSHQPVEALAAFNDETSFGVWTLRLSDNTGGGTGALTSWGITIKTPPMEHALYWNAEADLIKSDNIIFRIRAQSSVSPILWPALDDKSPSFRFAVPWYVRTVDESNNMVAGAMIYANGQPITQTATGLTATNQAGMINPGPLVTDTALVALAQQTEQPTIRDAHDGWTYRTYITSLNLDETGVSHPFIVSGAGEQLLTLRKDNPLILFNIVVSIEWDADEEYLTVIEDAFLRASDYLHDVTDGQMAFGQVTIYDKAEYWADADFQISTKNTVRPYAFIGGITSDDTAHSIRVGRFWNGSSGNQGDWNQPYGYRTLIHEFGHYALYLYDEYFVRLLDAKGHFIGQASAACTGLDVIDNDTDDANASLMYYQYNASELADSDRWTINCQNTEQARVNGEPDWQTVLAHYGGAEWELNTPSARGSVMSGPDAFPAHLLPFPTIEMHGADSGGTTRQLTVLGPDGNPFPNALVALYTTPYSYTVAIDQGLTDQDGRLTVYGALAGDSIQAASFDGAYAGAVRVGADNTYTLTLSATSSRAKAAQFGALAPYLSLDLSVIAADTAATQNGGSSPYLNLIPGSEGDTLLLKVHGAPVGSLPLNAVVIPGQGGGSPQSASLVYSPDEDAYVGQVGFAGVGLGSGEARAAGLAGGRWVSINSDYNLLQVLDAQANDLTSEDGNFQFHVDAGSLLNHADAYAVVLHTGYVPGPLPEGMQVVGSAYEVRFSGAATGLTKPGVLTMYYHPEVMGSVSNLAIHYWDAVDGEWERIGGQWTELDNSVTAAVEGFGIYVLMGQRCRVFLPIILRQ